MVCVEAAAIGNRIYIPYLVHYCVRILIERQTEWMAIIDEPELDEYNGGHRCTV